MKKLIPFITLFLSFGAFAQLGQPDLSFPKNYKFYQLEDNKFIASHAENNKLFFSKMDASLTVLWKDSVQFTNTNLPIHDFQFTNFKGSNKSLLTLEYHPVGFQIVDTNNFYEQIIVDFTANEILNRRNDTIKHAYALNFLPLSDSVIYYFVPKRILPLANYPYETYRIDKDAEMTLVAPLDSMSSFQPPVVKDLFRFIEDTIWRIQGTTQERSFAYSTEIDSLQSYLPQPNIAVPTDEAPNSIYRDFKNDDTLIVIRDAEFQGNFNVFFCNYTKDLNVRHHKLNTYPKINGQKASFINSAQIHNNKIYLLAQTSTQAKLFVYNLDFDSICEIAVPKEAENKLTIINHQLYYIFLVAPNQYAYYKISNCNQILGMDENVFEAPSATVYPNPSQGIFNIQANELLVGKTYQVTDILGKIVLKGKINSSNETLNLTSVQKGIYLLNIENQNSIRLIKD